MRFKILSKAALKKFILFFLDALFLRDWYLDHFQIDFEWLWRVVITAIVNSAAVKASASGMRFCNRTKLNITQVMLKPFSIKCDLLFHHLEIKQNRWKRQSFLNIKKSSSKKQDAKSWTKFKKITSFLQFFVSI